jgi:hypothetical protein
MARGALILTLLLAAGCRLDPAGRCDTRSDCAAGLDCLAGVCASCLGDADCSAWEGCGATGLCAPLAGRCDADADCASWDLCDASHTCVLRPDHCPNVTCGPIERCDPEHHCTLQPGRCNGGPDCVAWMAGCDVPSNTCLFSATPGDDVLALGTLTEGRADRGAAARASAPTKVEVGFDAHSGSDERAFIDPVTGELIYRHMGDPGGDTLRRFNRDAIVRDPVAALWTYPASPSADDELAIDATACPMTWGPWIMQAVAVEGVGAAPRPLQYGCPVSGGGLFDFYDSSGTRQLQGVQAVFGWSANGYRFVRAANLYQVISAAGAAVSVTALPVGAHLAYRTTANGFRVALYDYGTARDELWAIDEVSAAAALVGPYAIVPGGYAVPSWEALDSDGTLYGRSSFAAFDVVLKRPLSGATTVPYTEANMAAGSDDFTAATFSPYLRLDPPSFLFTVP